MGRNSEKLSGDTLCKLRPWPTRSYQLWRSSSRKSLNRSASHVLVDSLQTFRRCPSRWLTSSGDSSSKTSTLTRHMASCVRNASRKTSVRKMAIYIALSEGYPSDYSVGTTNVVLFYLLRVCTDEDSGVAGAAYCEQWVQGIGQAVVYYEI